MADENETMDLLDIAHQILEDHHISVDEVEMMRASIVADGAIDQEEAEMLFAINDAVSDGGSKCREYDQLFIEAITAFLLADEISWGVMDDTEWDWLKAMIGEDDDLVSWKPNCWRIWPRSPHRFRLIFSILPSVLKKSNMKMWMNRA